VGTPLVTWRIAPSDSRTAHTALGVLACLQDEPTCLLFSSLSSFSFYWFFSRFIRPSLLLLFFFSPFDSVCVCLVCDFCHQST